MHDSAQSTGTLALGFCGSVWTKQGLLSLVIYKHNRDYSPSEGKAALEIKELTLCSHHASSCPLCSCTRWGSATLELLRAAARTSPSPCTHYGHITDSEHDLPNTTPLSSHCLCMLRQRCVLVQLHALQLDGTGNATPRKVRQLWIRKIISKGVALLCFDFWLGRPSYQHPGMAIDREK